MKSIFKFIIQIYWLIPASKRSRCIFNTSCSRKVYETIDNKGWLSGLQVLKYRYKNCRSGYQFVYINDELHMITAAHQLIKNDEIIERIKPN